MRAEDLPSFKDLPAVKDMPHGCAWGLFDIDGKRDNLGTLNLLTPEVVMNARKEIQTGESVSLNWEITKCHKPGFQRLAPSHEIVDLAHLGFAAHDDVLHINTQSGSQWDGYKHVAHQETKMYYNGLHHDDVKNTMDNGIHHWNDRGGIVGRGVLLDYASYAEKHNIEYSVVTRHEIPLSDLKKIAEEENITFRPGDILLVRSGFTKWYDAASPEDQEAKVTNDHNFAGVQASQEVVEWLWNNHFAAVAGDAISWEAWPPQPPLIIHEFQLAFWGSPIGEMWDLEKLSEMCKEKKRWTFFLTSAPFNTPGGVASLANALAVF